jgi:two-component system, cell cycle sensor histidine kinase and response regulator CckA
MFRPGPITSEPRSDHWLGHLYHGFSPRRIHHTLRFLREGRERRSVGILIVDQEAYRSQSLARGLITMGYRVVEAGTLAEAVESIRHPNIAINFIITDCSTRILNHPEIIQAVHEKVPNIHLLMMTDHAKWHAEALLPWSWPTHCIEKPFKVEELAHLIETLRARSI